MEAFGNEKGLLAGLKVQNVKTKEIDSLEACPACCSLLSRLWHDWAWLAQRWASSIYRPSALSV